ncbi:MAG: 50S ribosomal protein L4 [Deltaproteobacteria bacterium GWA2_54_12]|uniref:Large ribosomal subunit protein uL4 n=1 Tax=uncultured delta proteobacterium Rifle_16ft_4_minimus_12842 TaxID=1665174 RepID=A0A0H4T2T3_9DELT|nr:50S ribosomal protein L4 [uncultured delta proteobacterium Rifle_16ft_4_minimus_12842]OGP14777.1 MAG: 50S ribosomal protein L4 [Deltaproteobacteria bacterium GWA2_54_12]
MNVEVLDSNGIKVSEIALSEEIFGGEVKEHLFYEVVKMQLANRRSGTASTKTKGEVSGGGIKPWKQKGTGRARSGSIRSPLWRHGGTVFGPHPRDYSYKLPRKVMKDALRNALKLRASEGKMMVFDAINLAEPKTKAAIELLKRSNLVNALIVIEGDNKNLELAVRNLKDFQVQKVVGLNVYDILNYDTLVITRSALEKVEAMAQ